jgi:hypothetical protein
VVLLTVTKLVKICKNNISNTDTQDSGGAILNMAPMKPTCQSGYDVKLIHVPHNLGGGGSYFEQIF